MSLITPINGTLFKITTFTSSGTWTRDARTKSVLVKVVGGGGGTMNGTNGASAGGTSSFGSHCSATGGAGATNTGERTFLGGSGSGGDINLTAPTKRYFDTSPAVQTLGVAAGIPSQQYGTGAVGIGGGGGGYAEKIILNTGSTESVTVGAGGSSGGVNPGSPGVVIVYEFL
jgi:hypothetical protein